MTRRSPQAIPDSRHKNRKIMIDKIYKKELTSFNLQNAIDVLIIDVGDKKYIGAIHFYLIGLGNP